MGGVQGRRRRQGPHALGAGVYTYNRNDPTVVTENGYAVPDAPHVQLNRIMTNNLSGPVVMNHIVNGCGPTVDGISDRDPFRAGFGDAPDYEALRYIASYPGCPN